MSDYYKTSATVQEPPYIGPPGRKITPSSISSETGGYPSRQGSSKRRQQQYATSGKWKLSQETDPSSCSSAPLTMRPAPINPKLKRRCQCCENVLRSLLPFILLFFYTLFGGMLFHFLEKEYQEGIKQRERGGREWWSGRELIEEPEAIQLNKRFTEIVLDRNYSQPRREREVRQALLWYLDQFGERLGKREEAGWRQRVEKDDAKWDFVSSLFYAFSIYTTIGYGKPAPLTTSGQILTVFYALIGIPLALITLMHLGYLLATVFIKIWSRIRHRPKRSYEPDWTPLAGTNLQDPLHEHRADLNTLSFPLSALVLLLIVWILITAALIGAMENPGWTYGGSCYFTFISLSTIGLGDYKPLSILGKSIGAILLFIGLMIMATIVAVFLFQLEALERAMERLIQVEYAQALENEETMEYGPLEIDDALKRMVSTLPFGSKCLYWLMPKCRKRSLRKYYKHKADSLNRGMQTDDYLWAMSAANMPRALKTIGEEGAVHEDTKSRDDVNSLVAMCDYSLPPMYKETRIEY